MSKQLNWLSAAQMGKGFAKRSLTPVDVAEACLAQIEKHDGELNAVCFLDRTTTLAMAKSSAARWKRGKPLSPLDGVPVLIKDLVLVQGWPTTRGSKTTDPNQPWKVDAPCVARLREAGAVFLGMTTTPEFGWKGVTDSPLYGITRNPWNLEKTPGGSSGGSAAGLAAGYAPLAIGTDGGGSIRIPAAFTNTFGLKPSFGRVPAWPPSAFGTVAHVGPMSRTVKDAALMLNVITRPDDRDWYALPYEKSDYATALKAKSTSLQGMKIAWSPNLGYVDVNPEIAKRTSAAVVMLADLGAEITEINPGFVDPAPCFRTLWWGGARSALGNLPPDKFALLEPALADVIRQAAALTVDDMSEANRQRVMLGSHMRQVMKDYAALITPTLPIAAFKAGQLQPGDPDSKGKWVNWTPFTYPFNLTQQPAASIPCGFTSAGLPAGLQIIGKMFDDATVLKIARAYERVTGFAKFRPEGF